MQLFLNIVKSVMVYVLTIICTVILLGHIILYVVPNSTPAWAINIPTIGCGILAAFFVNKRVSTLIGILGLAVLAYILFGLSEVLYSHQFPR